MFLENLNKETLLKINQQNHFSKENKTQFFLWIRELLKGEVQTKKEVLHNFKNQPIGEISYFYNSKQKQAFITEKQMSDFVAWPCKPQKQYFMWVPMCFIRAYIQKNYYFLYTESLQFFLICFKEATKAFANAYAKKQQIDKDELIASILNQDLAVFNNYTLLNGEKYLDFQEIQKYLGQKRTVRSTDYIKYGIEPVVIGGRKRFKATNKFLALLHLLKKQKETRKKNRLLKNEHSE